MASRESSWKMQTVERSIWKLYKDFKKEFLHRELEGIPVLFGDQLYLLPEAFPLKGIKILRPGLHLGTVKKNRFEPSHALAMALRPDDVRQCLELEEPERYLRGETLSCGAQTGWILLTVHGCSLGWGKASRGVLKNHYPKGLRRS